jgi:uncharacterized membrane protein
MEMNAPLAPKEDGNKTLAGIGYVIPIVGLIVIFLDQGKNDPWLRFNGWQGFFLAFLNIIPFIGWLAWLVFMIMYAMKAFKGEYFEIPVIGGLAKSLMK